MRIAMKFAYDGKKFNGYARQPKLKTVEGEIIRALINHRIIGDLKEACFRSASRTDKGVSALGNVISFNTERSQEIILSLLKKKWNDIVVYGVKKVDDRFYPRYAQQRIYRYYLRKHQLDSEQVIKTASLFTGEHDFRNFARIEEGKNPVRTIDTITVSEENDVCIIEFYAQTFLWHQIRRIIAALIKVCEGTLSQETIRYALQHPLEKADFGLAPAEPLLLVDVVYDFAFDYPHNALSKLRMFGQELALSLLS